MPRATRGRRPHAMVNRPVEGGQIRKNGDDRSGEHEDTLNPHHRIGERDVFMHARGQAAFCSGSLSEAMGCLE